MNETQSGHQSQSDTLIKNKAQTQVQKPTMYNVVLLNDDYTPMDFVTHILTRLFQKTENDAFNIMMEVHQNGRGIAGTFSREIAEEKQQQVIRTAEVNDFPLHCIVETA